MKKFVIVIIFVSLLIGCQQSESEYKAYDDYNASDTAFIIEENKYEPSNNLNGNSQNYTSYSSNTLGATSSSAAVENVNSNQKFARTAELKFKVENVINASYKIEDITARHNGYVTYTELNSEIQDVRTSPISADSSVETTRFTIKNQITLRVPNTELDSTLKEIAPLISFLDYRIIKADNVTLQLLGNDLTKERITKHEKRVTQAIDNKGTKLNQIIDGEDQLIYRQQEKDQALLANAKLMEEVSFSKIEINLYQASVIATAFIQNPKAVDEYKPGFWYRFGESIQFGWIMLTEIVLVLSKLWVFIATAGLIFVLYKRYGKKFFLNNK